MAIPEQGSAASPNSSLLTATSAVLISHLSEETRAIVAGRPSVSGYRRTRLQTALGGRANLLGANQETNGLELLVNREALGPKADKAKVKKGSDFIKPFFAWASSFLFTKPDWTTKPLCSYLASFLKGWPLSLPPLNLIICHMQDQMESTIFFSIFCTDAREKNMCKSAEWI